MRTKILIAAVVSTAIATSWVFIPGKAKEDLSTLPAYSAAVDYFLKLDGIEGESTDDQHKNEIQIESFSWGVSQGTSASGGGGGAGKATFQDLHMTKTIDKASPKLMLAVATGEHIKQAVLVGRKPGSGEKFLEIKLQDVLISSFKEAGDTSALPTDSFSINFAKIEFSYFPQDRDGSAGAPVKAGWDLKVNKKI